ncbi:hypothetical protein ACROYT_G026129 [Oculina patagonica]
MSIEIDRRIEVQRGRTNSSKESICVSISGMDLDANQITSLPDGVFVNLRDLEYLSLSDNKIQHLPNDLFCCSPKLQYLYLENNMISLITNETFARTTNIMHLSGAPTKSRILVSFVFDGYCDAIYKLMQCCVACGFEKAEDKKLFLAAFKRL